jgi:TRAP-type C4-dicarboxylate transport system permease small subunit
MTLFFRLAEKLLRAATLATFVVLIGVVLLQVVARVALPRAPAWTEELSRFAMIYLVAFGCGLAVKSRELVNVDIVLGALGPQARRASQIVAQLLCIGFCAAILMPAVEFSALGGIQTSPVLGVPMSWVYAATVVIAVALALFGLREILALWRGKAPPC